MVGVELAWSSSTPRGDICCTRSGLIRRAGMPTRSANPRDTWARPVSVAIGCGVALVVAAACGVAYGTVEIGLVRIAADGVGSNHRGTGLVGRRCLVLDRRRLACATGADGSAGGCRFGGGRRDRAGDGAQSAGGPLCARDLVGCVGRSHRRRAVRGLLGSRPVCVADRGIPRRTGGDVARLRNCTARRRSHTTAARVDGNRSGIRVLGSDHRAHLFTSGG